MSQQDSGGLTALGVASFGAGIPKDSVLHYETAVKTDKFLGFAAGAANIPQHNAPMAA